LQAVRRAIVEALPLNTSADGVAPHQQGHMYVPPAHLKALSLDRHLVIGARGVGKTFWANALNDNTLRTLLGSSVNELDRTDVSLGYAVGSMLDAYPDQDTFAYLLQQYKPYEVWRAVVARWLVKLLDKQDAVPHQTWETTVAWVCNNPESLAQLAEQANLHMTSRQRHGLLVFDALDRTSHGDWQQMDFIVRELLRVVLWLKSFSHLHAKVFLREDQFGRNVMDFPDASKLKATQVELSWAAHDLHGLVWQMLCNAPGEHGSCLRAIYTDVLKKPPQQQDNFWLLADEVKKEGSTQQRALFEALAGQWMGKGPRRGVPYIWAVNHLADGKQRVSPRSFIAAIREAAQDAERYSDHAYALHYESIKRGVQKASEIRVAEMAEDYPWMQTVMAPLKGMTVPCEFAQIETAWQKSVDGGLLKDSVKPLSSPRHSPLGWPGVRSDLEQLGVFESMKDGRVNLPDLYRVGFGLGRRGGVKPSR
jgi:hypothetical protein